MNNVDSDHGDRVIVHLCCLCDFSLLRYVGGKFILPICSHFVDWITVRTSFGLFILGYYINMSVFSNVDLTYEKNIPFGNMIAIL